MSFSSSLLRRMPRAVSGVPKLTRNLHSVPLLNHKETFTNNGVPGAFSPKAFKTSWTEYQEGLVRNLNRLVAETEFAHKPAMDIAILTARQADLAATFNYSSQAHNNHFFFEALSPVPTKMPEEFLALIPWTWSSPEALKTEFLTTAKKMFGNGWVWLVLDQTKYLRIVCTYNAGTPYGAAYRRQETDMNTTPDLSIRETTNAVRNSSVAGANWAVPLLNINVWEHAWVEDFGVNGKERYLEAVWDVIDWSVVSARFASTSARTLQH